jgi:transposase
MIGSTRSIRVYAYAAVTDMRKSYEGLAGLVRNGLGHDIMRGDLYLFVNRRRNRAKVLFFDGTGLCIFMKRMERGRFAAPWDRTDEKTLRLTTSELSVFLEGSKVVGKIPLILPDLGADCLNTPLAGSRKP